MSEVKLSEAEHAIQQIDEYGVMIGISREWYEEAKKLLADYESIGTPEQILDKLNKLRQLKFDNARLRADVEKYARCVHTCKFKDSCKYVVTNHGACFGCQNWQWRGEENNNESEND